MQQKAHPKAWNPSRLCRNSQRDSLADPEPTPAPSRVPDRTPLPGVTETEDGPESMEYLHSQVCQSHTEF
jgi:hypothetical protein